MLAKAGESDRAIRVKMVRACLLFPLSRLTVFASYSPDIYTVHLILHLTL
jgi:hypothetical protein